MLSKKSKKSTPSLDNNKSDFKSQSSSNQKKFEGGNEYFDCQRCGINHGRGECPAFGKRCQKCQRRGHFTNMCFFKRNDYKVDELQFEENLYIDSVETAKDDVENWYEEIMLDDLKIKFKLDSGAQCNVIPMWVAEKLNLRLKPSITKRLITYSDHKINVLGDVTVKCLIRNNKSDVTFKVVDARVSPIMGKKTCEKEKLILRVQQFSTDDKIFNGLGCLKDYEYDIDLVENPSFSIQPARRIPYAIRDKVKEEIDNMVKMGVLEKTHEVTPVVSPMVIVRKDKKVRVCLDPTDVNKNIIRRYFPLRTLEEISTKVKSSKYFTILDCRRGFWQIKVSKRTSKYLTMSTPWGRYSFKRLPFGLASAPEVFQDLMSKVLDGLENTECSMDDILIHAETKEQLSEITNKVIRRIDEVGLKLNQEKCQFNQESVKFLGHVLSSKGLSPDPEKIEAIKNLKMMYNKKRFNNQQHQNHRY